MSEAPINILPLAVTRRPSLRYSKIAALLGLGMQSSSTSTSTPTASEPSTEPSPEPSTESFTSIKLTNILPEPYSEAPIQEDEPSDASSLNYDTFKLLTRSSESGDASSSTQKPQRSLLADLVAQAFKEQRVREDMKRRLRNAQRVCDAKERLEIARRPKVRYGTAMRML
ncbi:MAG: hypothetical protein M1824_000346 [Vezdaea acicularis]|nr:MAG: hypothetical protein M1824_000346 [Vezdaea acicularis]